jgi:hypothetical protein
MAISLASLRTTAVQKPPLVLLYGTMGIGKTTFACSSPSPVVIMTEDGLGVINVPHFPVIKTWTDFMECIGALYSDEHEFETLVFDSLDHFEPIVWAEACQRNGWKDIEAPGYGKGYVEAAAVWREFFDALQALREKGMAIVMIAHEDIKRFDSPETDPYDRYQVKLHKRAGEYLQEAADMVLFANWKVATTKADVGFGQKVTRAIGRGERMLYTEERPAFDAKNRYSLPPELPLEWAALQSALAASLAQLEEQAKAA